MDDTLAPNATHRLRRVFVRGLRLRALLGVRAHEKLVAQRVVIAIDMLVEDDAAPRGIGPDRLGRVTDYERVVLAARAVAADGHTYLAETLAERIAIAALAEPRVQRCRVRVEKLDAFPDAAAVGVEVERVR
jgi:7,8-dihydroneopterin aldolase/epimerase/oxygenase